MPLFDRRHSASDESDPIRRWSVLLFLAILGGWLRAWAAQA